MELSTDNTHYIYTPVWQLDTSGAGEQHAETAIANADFEG